jgi:hypothetical protein
MILASGLAPSLSAADLLASTTAEAPSLSVEALAAVTVPFLSKTGRSVGIFSSLTFLYSSSSETVTSPFLSAITTGAISFLNAPAFQASAARLYDSMAYASWSSRVMDCALAVFSAQLPIATWFSTSCRPSLTMASSSCWWPKVAPRGA